MWGFNWIDLIIIVLLGLLVAQSMRTGALTQVFALGGFFAALFAAGWIVPHLLPLSDPTLKSMLNMGIVLGFAAIVGMLGYAYGQNIHWSFRIGKLQANHNYRRAENILGAPIGLVAGLIIVWLVGVGIGRLPFEGFSNSVNDSHIIHTLTDSLPPVPAVFAGFSRNIDPNSQPFVMSQPKPSNTFDFSMYDVEAAESKAKSSVVRITSFGCGGVVSGSGFVIGKNLVATNAHVIAGVKRPIVKYNGRSYEGESIFFDSGDDYAILRTKNLSAPSLKLAGYEANPGATVAILGFPGGNYRSVPGIVRDHLAVDGQNIWGQGIVTRDAYGIEAHTEAGSSGGPAVLSDGTVAGMVFSKSSFAGDYAYILTPAQLSAGLHKAEKSTQTVNTGACTAN